MQELMEQMLAQKIWAVVGASDNKEKFGYKVFKRLISEGYKVYPIHPKCIDIEGAECYKVLDDLPETPGAVSVIIPPSAGLEILEDAARLGIKRLWFQPGAQSDEIIKRAGELKMQVVYNNCVLTALDFLVLEE